MYNLSIFWLPAFSEYEAVIEEVMNLGKEAIDGKLQKLF